MKIINTLLVIALRDVTKLLRDRPRILASLIFPFVFIGMMYGIVAGLITLLLFYPITYWLGGLTADFFIGINVFDHYISNFLQVSLIVLGSGIFIGAISSYLAIMKFLKK